MTTIARIGTGVEIAGRPRLVRVRWAVRAALALGVAASVAANTLHASTGAISKTIAAWPPVALLLTIELISRVPVHRRWLAAARLAATVTIAGIAAWISYWHMAAVVTRYGEAGPTPYLLPLSVDGLILVASVSLIELTGRLGTIADTQLAVPDPRTRRLTPAALPIDPDRTTVASYDAVSRRGAAAGGSSRTGPHLAMRRVAAPTASVAGFRSAADVAAAVARLRAQQPPPHPTQIAAEVGRSVRQVLRIIKRLDEQSPERTPRASSRPTAGAQ